MHETLEICNIVSGSLVTDTQRASTTRGLKVVNQPNLHPLNETVCFFVTVPLRNSCFVFWIESRMFFKSILFLKVNRRELQFTFECNKVELKFKDILLTFIFNNVCQFLHLFNKKYRKTVILQK